MSHIATALTSASAAWASVRCVSLRGTYVNQFGCANTGLLKIIEVKLPVGLSLGEEGKIQGI